MNTRPMTWRTMLVHAERHGRPPGIDDERGAAGAGVEKAAICLAACQVRVAMKPHSTGLGSPDETAELSRWQWTRCTRDRGTNLPTSLGSRRRCRRRATSQSPTSGEGGAQTLEQDLCGFPCEGGLNLEDGRGQRVGVSGAGRLTKREWPDV